MLAQKALSAEALAPMLRRLVEEKTLAYKAGQVGAQIRQEDGVGNAIERIRLWYGESAVMAK